MPPAPLGSTNSFIADNTRLKSTFVHALISSRLNTRYIQPHYPLSDDIVSHSVPLLTLCKIYDAFKTHGMFVASLQTKYYDLDKVFSVTEKQNNANIIKQYQVIYRNDYKILDFANAGQTTLEYVGENRFNLDKETFQVKKTYHHERQLILFSLDAANFTLELEILLEGIEKISKRKHLFNLLTGMNKELVDDPAILGSCSLRFIVKNCMVRDELNEHVDTLHEIISVVNNIPC
jgi:hypothetical protein